MNFECGHITQNMHILLSMRGSASLTALSYKDHLSNHSCSGDDNSPGLAVVEGAVVVLIVVVVEFKLLL